MTPTREELMTILRGVCDPDKVDPLIPAGDMVVVTPEELESFALAMYRKGQEDMRERAASVVDFRDWNSQAHRVCAEIRALPIGD